VTKSHRLGEHFSHRDEVEHRIGAQHNDARDALLGDRGSLRKRVLDAVVLVSGDSFSYDLRL